MKTAHRGWPEEGDGIGLRAHTVPNGVMSTGAAQETVTALLLKWGAGRPEDRERLFEAVQEELRRIATTMAKNFGMDQLPPLPDQPAGV